MNPLNHLLIRAAYYPTLWYNRVMCSLGIWRKWDWVDSFILLGAVPSPRDVARLKSLGIRAVVNLCEEFDGHRSAMTECGIIQLHLPTYDYHCPSRAKLLCGVEFMSEQINAGRKIYVHCKAGRGRSATLVLCFLMTTRGISAKEAEDIVRKSRLQVDGNLAERPPVRTIECTVNQPGTS